MFGVSLGSCTELHHAQIGEIDTRPGYFRERFEIKVSESGVDIKQSDRGARKIYSRPRDSSNDIMRILGYLQMGPRTGAPVFSSTYARDSYALLRKACSRGWPTNLVIVRESRSDPVIGGEIIHILGECETRE